MIKTTRVIPRKVGIRITILRRIKARIRFRYYGCEQDAFMGYPLIFIKN